MQGERSQFARESGECVASSFRGTQREPKGMRDQSPKEGQSGVLFLLSHVNTSSPIH